MYLAAQRSNLKNLSRGLKPGEKSSFINVSTSFKGRRHSRGANTGGRHSRIPD